MVMGHRSHNRDEKSPFPRPMHGSASPCITMHRNLRHGVAGVKVAGQVAEPGAHPLVGRVPALLRRRVRTRTLPRIRTRQLRRPGRQPRHRDGGEQHRHAGQPETRQPHRHQHTDRQDRGVRGSDHGRVLGATRTGPVTGTGISHTPQLCPYMMTFP